jgi:K+/H+ antiporter YhaU regulatory subunit KhtT
MGEPGALKDAGEILDETKEDEFGHGPGGFATAEVEVDDASAHVGRSLAEMKFRKAYGVTVIGIVRDLERLPMPRPEERLMASVRLMVIGTHESVEKMKKRKI